MTGWKSLAMAAGCLLLAGGAQAQKSLFEPPAANGTAAPLTPPADSAAAPAAAAAAAPAKAKPKRKGPAPARALSISNESGSALATLEVSADGKTASLGKQLASGGTATLRLPALKSCNVTITATFTQTADPDIHQQDICKDRKVRFVN
jgi:hypothetical protein